MSCCINADQISTSSLYIPDFLQETIDTLALLLPRSYDGCNEWLRRCRERRNLDPNLGTLGIVPRDLERYPYWRDRLLVIAETFDRAQPHTLRQWWYDRRDKVRWYTFWVAVTVLCLTVIFGLIQSITAIIGAWAAVESMKHNNA